MGAAAAAIALLALTAAPASGGFRYVPPETEAAAEAAETLGPEKGENAGVEDVESPARVSPPVPGPAVPNTGASGTSVWRVHEGEMLRAVLARWSARAGTDVLFLTDRRYRLDGEAAFEGGFADAAQALLRSLSHLPHAPVAARSEGGTALVVRHRMPASPARGGKP